jgi:hypothetical protein
MKAAVIGALLGAGLVIAMTVGAPGVRANPSVPGAGTDLITLSTALGDHRQQLTVIDPKLRVMGVYQIDGTTGEIALKSVRNFSWDLQMTEFNAASPLPREIRSLLEQR